MESTLAIGSAIRLVARQTWRLRQSHKSLEHTDSAPATTKQARPPNSVDGFACGSRYKANFVIFAAYRETV